MNQMKYLGLILGLVYNSEIILILDLFDEPFFATILSATSF